MSKLEKLSIAANTASNPNEIFTISEVENGKHVFVALTPAEVFELGVEVGQNSKIIRVGLNVYDIRDSALRYKAELYTLGIAFARSIRGVEETILPIHRSVILKPDAEFMQLCKSIHKLAQVDHNLPTIARIISECSPEAQKIMKLVFENPALGLRDSSLELIKIIPPESPETLSCTLDYRPGFGALQEILHFSNESQDKLFSRFPYSFTVSEKMAGKQHMVIKLLSEVNDDSENNSKIVEQLSRGLNAGELYDSRNIEELLNYARGEVTFTEVLTQLIQVPLTTHLAHKFLPYRLSEEQKLILGDNPSLKALMDHASQEWEKERILQDFTRILKDSLAVSQQWNSPLDTETLKQFSLNPIDAMDKISRYQEFTSLSRKIQSIGGDTLKQYGSLSESLFEFSVDQLRKIKWSGSSVAKILHNLSQGKSLTYVEALKHLESVSSFAEFIKQDALCEVRSSAPLEEESKASAELTPVVEAEAVSAENSTEQFLSNLGNIRLRAYQELSRLRCKVKESLFKGYYDIISSGEHLPILEEWIEEQKGGRLSLGRIRPLSDQELNNILEFQKLICNASIISPIFKANHIDGEILALFSDEELISERCMSADDIAITKFFRAAPPGQDLTMILYSDFTYKDFMKLCMISEEQSIDRDDFYYSDMHKINICYQNFINKKINDKLLSRIQQQFLKEGLDISWVVKHLKTSNWGEFKNTAIENLTLNLDYIKLVQYLEHSPVGIADFKSEESHQMSGAAAAAASSYSGDDDLPPLFSAAAAAEPTENRAPRSERHSADTVTVLKAAAEPREVTALREEQMKILAATMQQPHDDNQEVASAPASSPSAQKLSKLSFREQEERLVDLVKIESAREVESRKMDREEADREPAHALAAPFYSKHEAKEDYQGYVAHSLNPSEVEALGDSSDAP